MGRTLSFFWVLFLLVLGASLLGWVGYNKYVDQLVETEGKSALVAVGLALLFMLLGMRRIRRHHQTG